MTKSVLEATLAAAERWEAGTEEPSGSVAARYVVPDEQGNPVVIFDRADPAVGAAGRAKLRARAYDEIRDAIRTDGVEVREGEVVRGVEF